MTISRTEGLAHLYSTTFYAADSISKPTTQDASLLHQSQAQGLVFATLETSQQMTRHSGIETTTAKLLKRTCTHKRTNMMTLGRHSAKVPVCLSIVRCFKYPSVRLAWSQMTQNLGSEEPITGVIFRSSQVVHGNRRADAAGVFCAVEKKSRISKSAA